MVYQRSDRPHISFNESVGPFSHLAGGLGVGVTQAPFVKFSVSKLSDLAKEPVTFFNHIHI